MLRSCLNDTGHTGYLHNEVTGCILAISWLMRLVGVDIQYPIEAININSNIQYMSLLQLKHKQLQPNDGSLARAGCNNYMYS